MCVCVCECVSVQGTWRSLDRQHSTRDIVRPFGGEVDEVALPFQKINGVSGFGVAHFVDVERHIKLILAGAMRGDHTSEGVIVCNIANKDRAGRIDS